MDVTSIELYCGLVNGDPIDLRKSYIGAHLTHPRLCTLVFVQMGLRVANCDEPVFQHFSGVRIPTTMSLPLVLVFLESPASEDRVPDMACEVAIKAQLNTLNLGVNCRVGDAR